MTPPPPTAGSSGRRTAAALVAGAAALVVAFVAAPGPLAAGTVAGAPAGERQLTEAFRAAFAGYWRSGAQRFPPDLRTIVDYWLRYHVVKATVAALLLAVLVALASRIARALRQPDDRRPGDQRPDGRRPDGRRPDGQRPGGTRPDGQRAGARAALASAGVTVSMLAVLALATVMANVQGALAPFASLLPLLPTGGPGGAAGAAGADGAAGGAGAGGAVGAGGDAMATTMAQVRGELAGGPARDAVPVMVGDFSRYHLVMVVIAALVAAAALGIGAVQWRRFAATPAADRRSRRVLGAFGALSAVVAVAAIVLAWANATTVADPAPALLALFQGGW